jgi:hypothetical protein
MYLFIACAVVIFVLTAAASGTAAARAGMPRSRRVQPHTRETHDLIAREATVARNNIDLERGRLGF